MKIYLAHHLKDRHEILKWQRKMERNTHVKFVNPFYDVHREDIEALDRKEQPEEALERTLEECVYIVERDLEAIRKSDAMLAFVKKTIGTSMEIIMASRVFNMPVFVISKDYCNHSWIRANSNKQFRTRKEFEEWIELERKI